MADNLEPTGVKFVAEDADKFVRDSEKVNRAMADTSKAIENAAGSSGLSALGGAGTEAGAAVSAGMAVASVAIGAVSLAASGAVAAIAAIGNAISTAVNLGSVIDDIQLATGASAELAGQIYGTSRVAGVSANSTAMAFVNLGNRIDQAGAKAVASMGRVAKSTDGLNTRLERLNEDHAARLADIDEARVDRLAAINEQIASAQVSFNERLQRSNEDYSRSIEDSRRQLNERLASLEENHVERVQAINERLANLSTDTAQAREDSERNLSHRLADLNQRASDQIADAQKDGAKTQAKIQEDLQSELYRIEQKYNDKRQSLQDKIADPGTNPILRAYYKTQLKSLSLVEKAEKASAAAKAGGQAQQAKDETALVLQAIRDRLNQQTALEQAKANEDAARDQANYQRRLAELQAALAKENTEYVKQGNVLRIEQTRRESELASTRDRQLAASQVTYDKEVAQAASAQAKILAETDKRVAKEQQSYARGIEDVKTGFDNLASSLASGGGRAAGAIDPIVKGIGLLGLSIDQLKGKNPGELLTSILDSAHKLISDGNLDKARDALISIFGPSEGLALLKVARTWGDEMPRLGLTDAQIESIRKYKEESAKLGLQTEYLSSEIGLAFLPIAQAMNDVFQEFWKEHGPEVVTALKGVAEWISEHLVPATRDAWHLFNDQLLPAFRDISSFVNTYLVPAFKDQSNAQRDIYESGRATRKFLDEELGPAFDDLAKALNTDVTAAINGVKRTFDDLKTGIEGVVNFIGGTVASKVKDFQGLLDSLHVPHLFTPGSPTPFEMGLRGISDAMREINRVGLPALQGTYNMSATGAQAMAATPAQMAARSTTNNNQRSANTASITMNFNGNPDKSQVADGIYSALVRAGLVIVH